MNRLHRCFEIIVLILLVPGLAHALDREAFTFTRYDLKITVDPAKGTLAATGSVQLRNDSAAPQNLVALQISSSLQWTALSLQDKTVPFLVQPYTSDIDHTGSLSEAIVTLPQPVPPQTSVTINVAYEGAVARDSTRLTHIGTPQDLAVRSDWDQVAESFTAVRGIGYVTWFPVSLPAVSLAEGESTFNAIAAWRERQTGTRLNFDLIVHQPPTPAQRLQARVNSRSVASCEASAGFTCTRVAYDGFSEVPVFAIAAYEQLDRPSVAVSFLPEHSSVARDYAASIERTEPAIAEWLGPQRDKVQIVELADSNVSPFESGAFLFTPVVKLDNRILDVNLSHQVAHAHFSSPRRWIAEGVAYLMQNVLLERQIGHRAAVNAISRFYPQLASAENAATKPPAGSAALPKGEPLVSTNDPFFFRSKALSVWLMLRDMVGEDVIRAALQAYRPGDDRQPAYMQSLLERPASPGAPQRNLEWFFDDWVYRDRGLPDFRIESAYARKTLNGTYVVTVTVENTGRAGAEVPVLVSSSSGERQSRVIVQAGAKAVVRIPFPAAPARAVVNDGSVPESNMSNNSFDIPPAPAQ